MSSEAGVPQQGSGSRAGVGVQQKSLQLGSRCCWIREPRGDPLLTTQPTAPFSRSSILRDMCRQADCTGLGLCRQGSVWEAAVLGD